MSDAGRFVVATAGHVDHGKSTLVRALTGSEPDRWAEEHRRGLTIDLGFAWATLASGREVAFVDVPGHQRFLGNMLAGLGPVPVVCFLVAADAGWQAQSADHRDAVAALDIRHGLIVISRADRAPARVDEVLTQTRRELAGTGLQDAPAVVVSALSGTGLDTLRSTLDRVLAGLPAPATTGRLRLWVDRSFTISGAGPVATGTLAAGRLAPGDRLELVGGKAPQPVTVRGLQSRGAELTRAVPVDRVAVNLRGVSHLDVHRGDALLSPGAWPVTAVLDVRRISGAGFSEAPNRLTVHVGTAAVPARLRPFDDDHARLTPARPLPLVVGDRLVLRDPGTRRILGGAQILDVDPPALHRRGDGRRRSRQLAAMGTGHHPGRRRDAVDLAAEVARRGAVAPEHLTRLGLMPEGTATPPRVLVVGRWWVHQPAWQSWLALLRDAVSAAMERDPLAAGLSLGAASNLLALPELSLLPELVIAAGLEQHRGYLRLPGTLGELGSAEPAIAELEHRLRTNPFDAPEAYDLADLGLGTRELAAAERARRILRLPGEVVLLPSAPALAMRKLAGLSQPFTTSQARQALDTTRRVVIPLLEHLDARGWTRRLDAGHREVTR